MAAPEPYEVEEFDYKNIAVFHICKICHKEYQVPLEPVNLIFGAGMLHTFGDCPICHKRNDIWIRIVVTG